MRPLRLKLQGLRSYRSPQQIDFEDKGLVAIVGDTGAGKSSLLEALCVALYGSCSWSRKDISLLISHGAETLRVELEFQAEGKTWRVTRAKSHGNYPPAIHRLECLSDGAAYDGVKDVNDRVEALVGLDYNQFLRAVMLPQGRFQALLQASPVDRTQILKGIFRLDVLDRMRESARRVLDERRPKLESLRAQREILPADPRKEAANEEERAKEAREKADRLTQIGEQWQRVREEQDEARKRAEALVAARSGPVDVDLAGLSAQLERMALIEDSLDREGAQQREERHEIEKAIEAIESKLREAEGEGLGPAPLGAARGELERARVDFPKHVARRAEIEQRSRELSQQREELVGLERSLAEKSESVGEAKRQLARAREELGAAKDTHGRARDLLSRFREQEKRLKELSEQRRATDEEKGVAQRELTARQAALLEAEAALTAAEKRLREAQRRDAAVHAAADCAPGDPCPVCERKLPAEWAAPQAPDIERTQGEVDAARTQQRERAASQSAAETRLATLASRFEELASRIERLESEVAAAQRELLSVLPLFDSSLGDEELLAPAQRRMTLSQELVQAAEQECTSAEVLAQDARVAFESLQTAVEKDRQRLEGDQQALEQAEASLREALSALPVAIRPSAPIDLVSIRAALTAVNERARALLTLERTLGEHRSKLSEVIRSGDLLLERRRKEVEAPLEACRHELAEIRLAAAQLVKVVGGEEPTPLPREAGAGELRVWAGELGKAVEDLLACCRREEEALAVKLADLTTVERGLVHLGEVESGAALRDQILGAQVAAREAAGRVEEAQRRIARADELDDAMGREGPLLEGLEETRRLLQDGQFVGWLVNQKQRALLVAASKLLAGMTNDRYGFSEDFEIVDRLSGQARDTKTLSGGETFLASLSLALGLSEIAARAGGRLEALFLDEGFGSLDGNALGEALDALTKQAESGRLVGVISHLRAVAENIDDVLYVSRETGGSEVRWLTAQERGVMVEEEVGAGLLH